MNHAGQHLLGPRKIDLATAREARTAKMSNPIKISPRWKEMEPEVALKLNEVINTIAAGIHCIPKARTLKLLKHLRQHLDDLTRLGMFVADGEEETAQDDTSEEPTQ